MGERMFLVEYRELCPVKPVVLAAGKKECSSKPYGEPDTATHVPLAPSLGLHPGLETETDGSLMASLAAGSGKGSGPGNKAESNNGQDAPCTHTLAHTCTYTTHPAILQICYLKQWN